MEQFKEILVAIVNNFLIIFYCLFKISCTFVPQNNQITR